MPSIDALRQLLSPHSPDEFLARYWEKDFLHVARNDSNYYKNVLTLEELDEYLSRNDIRYPSLRMIRSGKGIAVSEFSKPLKFGTYLSDGLIDVDRVFRLYEEGASVVLQLMRSSLSSLAFFTNALQQSVRFNVEATVYITPPSEQGFTTHFDTHSVIVLQIAGRKKWRLYDYPRRLPLLNETSDIVKFSVSDPTHEVTLAPGDLLYVPRGVAHDATSTGEGKSVHITLGLFPLMWRDLIEQHISSLANDVAFRRAPTNYFHQGVSRDFGKHWIEMVTKAFGTIDLANLRREALGPHIARQNRMTSGRIATALHRAVPITEDSVVRVRSGIVFDIEQRGASVSVRFYDRKITFPSAVAGAVTHALSGNTVRVGDLQANLSSNGRNVLARKLLREGLLEMVMEENMQGL